MGVNPESTPNNLTTPSAAQTSHQHKIFVIELPPPRTASREATMSDSANSSTPLIENHEFLADCCRYAEGISSESAVRKKWRFSEDDWEKLGSDDELVRAIEAESVRRIRNGTSKRERAQVLIVEGPAVLGDIMRNSSASPRHRVDAVKALDALSDTGPDSPPARDVFVIKINIGGDVHTFGTLPDSNTSKIIDHDRVDTINNNNTDDDDDTPKWLGIPTKKDDRDQGGGIPW
jgi:hypothetical protein